MIKKIIILTFIFILVSTLTVNATAPGSTLHETFEGIISEQLNHLDTKDWDAFLKEIENQGNGILDTTSAKEFIGRLITGNFSFKIQDVLNTLLNIFFREFTHNLLLMGQIIVIAVLCGILKNMKDSFNSSVGEISYFVCYLIVIMLIIQSLISILQVGRTGIEQMVHFMQILLPLLMTLLVAMGSLASAAIMQPAIALLLGFISTFLKNTMLPLIMLSAIFTLVNNIGDAVNLVRLGKLVNNLCTWTLTGVFTIFIGVLSIQGVMAASFDGISIRTAKFAIDTFVPIVGGMFSQALDTIIGCSLLVKNAVGVAGLIVVGLICITPAVKILALIIIYKLASALLEPISDARIVDCLNSIGNILTVLFITVMSVAVMFFMTVTLMIGTGNITVMLR